MLREFVTTAAAGSADLAMVVMLMVLFFFAVTLLWVFGKNRIPQYEEASRLPLEEVHHE